MRNIICVIGTNEVERSIFTVSLANLLMDKNKVLIIDFDILNNNLHEILGIKKYSQKIRNKIKNLHYPLFVKPLKAGSSFGITKIKSEDNLKEALEEAYKYDNKVIIEENIDGII